MTEEETGRAIRRILVALDASAHSMAALEEAASLAARMEAELIGIFVEDINLMTIASLPFARQVSYPSGVEEPLNTARMERELKMTGERALRALKAAAERAQTPWSFRIVRGEVAAEILTAASEADIVFLGKGGLPPAHRRRLGSTAMGVAAGAPRALVLVQDGARIEDPMMAVYDGSRGSQQALRVAIRLAEANNHRLMVFILAGTPEIGEGLEQEARRIVAERLEHLQCRKLDNADPHRLAQAVQEEGRGLLILGSGPFVQEAAIRELLREIDNCLLLVQ